MSEKPKAMQPFFKEKLFDLDTAVAKGSLKRATKLHQSLLKELEATKNTPDLAYSKQAELARISASLQSTELKLAEMRDWQVFATNPKREALCRQMDALLRSNQHPLPIRAKLIHNLQEEWKTLGPSDSREGRRLWHKFKRLADAAYKPCTVYFGEMKHLRQQNFQRRMEIIESLQYYLEHNKWEQANWAAASDIVKQSKIEWLQFREVPRNKKQRLDQLFNTVLSRLQDKLLIEQTANHQKKQDLINTLAAALAELNGGSPVPLEKLSKRLQLEWKQVGITLRREDQKLWRKFRLLCDQVFSLRSELANETAQKAPDARRAKSAINVKQQETARQSLVQLSELSRLCDQLEDKTLTLQQFESHWATTGLPEKKWLQAIEQRRSHLVIQSGEATEEAVISTIEQLES